MPDQLVKIVHNEILADSRLIAKGMSIEHESFMRTIAKHHVKLEEHGVLRFEIGKPKSAKGGRPEKYALLNFDQSLFAMTLSRNTERVVELKSDLVKSFKKARFLLDNITGWQTGRNLLKDDNAEAMHSVKLFIDVAIGMGQSPDKANKTYGNVHRMLYRELFGLKISKQNPLPSNFRDTLSKDHFLYLRNAIKIVEKVFSDALSVCSDYHLPYHTALSNVKSYTLMMGGPFAISIETPQLRLF